MGETETCKKSIPLTKWTWNTLSRFGKTVICCHMLRCSSNSRCLFFVHSKLDVDGLHAEILYQITWWELHRRQCFSLAVLLDCEHHGQGSKLKYLLPGKLEISLKKSGNQPNKKPYAVYKRKARNITLLGYDEINAKNKIK